MVKNISRRVVYLAGIWERDTFVQKIDMLYLCRYKNTLILVPINGPLGKVEWVQTYFLALYVQSGCPQA